MEREKVMINYGNIAESVSYYEDKGYKQIEVPWMIPTSASNITKPVGCKDFCIADSDLVLPASGEQSFLSMYMNGYLPLGKFQTVTPCFRHDPIDSIHHLWFLKNELINTQEVTTQTMLGMVTHAKNFFESILEDKVDIVEVAGQGIDLEYKGVELGSYGIRKCDFLNWVYGTGCAEPRLSFAREK